MQFPNTPTTRTTEAIMAGLRAAGVIKEDIPGHPTNYNRAYEVVRETLVKTGLPKPLVEDQW